MPNTNLENNFVFFFENENALNFWNVKYQCKITGSTVNKTQCQLAMLCWTTLSSFLVICTYWSVWPCPEKLFYLGFDHIFLCMRLFLHGYDDGRLPGDPRTCLLLTTEKAVFCNSMHRGTQLYHSFVLIWNLNLASTPSLECSPGLLLFAVLLPPIPKT